MKFYNRYYNSCYDELLTYYPDFYKSVYEMNGILSIFGRFLDDLEKITEQTYLNNFIISADADTIRIWENMLHITCSESISLQQRRQVIIGYLCGGKHMGEQEIRGIISNYTENPADIDFLNGLVSVMVYGEIFSESSLINTLRQKIPAHLALDIRFKLPRRFSHAISFKYGCGSRIKIKSARAG